MLSPRSRGKGGRRVPWRDGGGRKQKAAAWRKQATYAVDDVSQLSGELVELPYRCHFGRSAAEGIYRLDQEVARSGVRYHAEFRGSRWSPSFVLRVPADRADTVRAIITQLQKR